MDSKEYIRELTAGGTPDWCVDQIAQELDKLEAELTSAKNETHQHSLINARLSLRNEELKTENKRLLEQIEDLQKEIEWKQKQIVSLRHRGGG